VLFWLNSISAVVDNATLTAAEIGPSLSVAQQRAMLMGLLISGGMLIPGTYRTSWHLVVSVSVAANGARWADNRTASGGVVLRRCSGWARTHRRRPTALPS